MNKCDFAKFWTLFIIRLLNDLSKICFFVFSSGATSNLSSTLPRYPRRDVTQSIRCSGLTRSASEWCKWSIYRFACNCIINDLVGIFG